MFKKTGHKKMCSNIICEVREEENIQCFLVQILLNTQPSIAYPRLGQWVSTRCLLGNTRKVRCTKRVVNI